MRTSYPKETNSGQTSCSENRNIHFLRLLFTGMCGLDPAHITFFAPGPAPQSSSALTSSTYLSKSLCIRCGVLKKSICFVCLLFQYEADCAKLHRCVEIKQKLDKCEVRNKGREGRTSLLHHTQYWYCVDHCVCVAVAVSFVLQLDDTFSVF